MLDDEDGHSEAEGNSEASDSEVGQEAAGTETMNHDDEAMKDEGPEIESLVRNRKHKECT